MVTSVPVIGNPVERVLRAGFIACLAAVGLYLAVSAFEPFRTNWGDPWSDGNAMTAGRYFAEDGFFATAFTPILDVGSLGPDSLRYTHYPPLPDLVAGVVQKVIGSGHLGIHRLLALLWSAIALLLFFRYITALFDQSIAYLATFVVATNLLFIQYADTVHHIPLYMMTGFGCLLAAVRWLDTKRTSALLLVAVSTFFCFLASYDYYFFLSVMILATVKFRGAKIFRGHGLGVILVFGFAGIASIVVKNLLVIWAEGYEHWHQDLVFQFFERATSAHSRQYKEGLRDVIFWRLWRFYSPVFFAAGALQLIAIIDRVRGMKPAVTLRPLIFLAAAVPFMFVFSQLVVEQYHPMLLMLPFAGTAIAVMVRFAWKSSPRAAAVVMAFYLGWQAWQFALFKKAFLDDTDVVAVQKVLEPDRHQLLMSNIFVDGPVRYLWNKHLFGITTDLVALRDQFEVYGKDSPLTIVLLKQMAPHMYDKGIYAYFSGERRWSWITRPDYYRNAWKRRFDKMDKEFREGLEGLGTVAYESKQLHVVQFSEQQVIERQRARLPAVTPAVIDFETLASEPFKMRGFAGRTGGTKEMPGFSLMYSRQPSKLVFTLHGHEWHPIAPPVAVGELQLRLPNTRGVRMSFDLSTEMISQLLRIRVNGREVGSVHVYMDRQPKRVTVDVPAGLLRTDGIQTVELEAAYAWDTIYALARLHRIEIAPL